MARKVSDLIMGADLEFHVAAPMPVDEVLSAVPRHFTVVPFEDVKHTGWMVRLPDGVWVRFGGDAMWRWESKKVAEGAIMESCGPFPVVEQIARLQELVKKVRRLNSEPVRFFQTGCDLYGQRASLHVTAQMPPASDADALRQVIIPFLATQPGPGGLTPEGYARSPRLTRFTTLFVGGEGAITEAPVIYHHPLDARTGRLHLSLEVYRTLDAIRSTVAPLACMLLAAILDPGCFPLRLHDAVGEARAVSLDLGNTHLLRVTDLSQPGEPTRRLTRRQVQRELCLTSSAVFDRQRRELPGWLEEAMGLWSQALEGELEEFAVKRAFTEQWLEGLGLPFGSAEAQRLIGDFCRILEAGVDPEYLFGVPSESLVESGVPNRVPWRRVPELWQRGLRNVFMFEALWSEVPGLSDELLPGAHPDPRQPLALAPRALARQALMEKHLGDPSLRVSWTQVETSSSAYAFSRPSCADWHCNQKVAPQSRLQGL